MLHVKDSYSIQVSSFFGLYLASSSALDFFKSRAYLCTGLSNLRLLGNLAGCGSVLKLILAYLDDDLPRRRSRIAWFKDAMLLGFRTIKNAEDLDRLYPDFSTVHLTAKFHSLWIIEGELK